MKASRLLTLTGLLAAIGAGAAMAGEVDLQAAGCPALPLEGQWIGLNLVLAEDGSASDCKMGDDWKYLCGFIYDDREGFLCISFHGKRLKDTVSAEGTLSSKVSRLVVDGIEAEPVYGNPDSVIIKDFQSYPSGDTWTAVVERIVGTTTFTVTLDVTVTAPGTVRIDAARITYPD